MEQIWKWLKIQPWWIKLVIGLTAVVAMVWGTTSCTGQLYLEKRGFHQDTPLFFVPKCCLNITTDRGQLHA